MSSSSGLSVDVMFLLIKLLYKHNDVLYIRTREADPVTGPGGVDHWVPRFGTQMKNALITYLINQFFNIFPPSTSDFSETFSIFLSTVLRHKAKIFYISNNDQDMPSESRMG